MSTTDARIDRMNARSRKRAAKRKPIPDHWALLTMVTMNAGPAPLDRVVTEIRKLMPDIIFCQEFGDQSKLRAALLVLGYGVVEGHGKAGQKSTPTFYRKVTVPLRDAESISLLGRVFSGKGAGPSMLKPKWLNLAHLLQLASRRLIEAASFHGPASTQFELRMRLAKTMFSGVIAAYGKRHLRVAAGDTNAKKKWVDRMFWVAGWTNSDREGGWLKTHDQQNYDRVFWRRCRWVRFVTHHTVDIGSDHLMKVVVLAVKPRKSKKKES